MDHMTQTPVTIDGNRIITVTQGGLLYRDYAGTIQWIDFRQCRDTWLAQCEQPTKTDYRYTGCRTPRKAEACYVRFFSSPPVIIHFHNDGRRQLDLIVPLSKAGWFTRLCNDDDRVRG